MQGIILTKEKKPNAQYDLKDYEDATEAQYTRVKYIPFWN